MDFTENNRISHRQLYRQIVLAFGAPFFCACWEGKRFWAFGERLERQAPLCSSASM